MSGSAGELADSENRLGRIDQASRAREDKQEWLRTFRLVHQNISFGGVPAEKRLELGRDGLARLVASESAEDYAELFWDVAGYDDESLRLILEVAPQLDDRGVQNIAMLIGKAIPRLAFTNTSFARELLAHFTGKNRERLVAAFAYQARRYGGGVFAGNPEDLMAQQQKQFTDQLASFPEEPGLEDLARALRKFTH